MTICGLLIPSEKRLIGMWPDAHSADVRTFPQAHAVKNVRSLETVATAAVQESPRRIEMTQFRRPETGCCLSDRGPSSGFEPACLRANPGPGIAPSWSYQRLLFQWKKERF